LYEKITRNIYANQIKTQLDIF